MTLLKTTKIVSQANMVSQLGLLTISGDWRLSAVHECRVPDLTSKLRKGRSGCQL